MNDGKTVERNNQIEMEFEIDEPPHKVWRAISMPEFRETWLPNDALADRQAAAITPGEEVSYRMREPEAPFTESLVTFRIAPNGSGGTCLRVIHELDDARTKRVMTAAANSNSPLLMLAA
ncbi:hypothetical protein ATN84_00950 [Paramesorhizobium deserti]|uniref:Polyketide cyclase n=1 Tax=Paramesorhizobium deserti TaxID=1494590 RepID=A0A135HYY0_9HYPH|nr:hypothetical protein [Paramesorhizobium deserti]KXF78402.1 hypothetical protein ATN84_00950 [Paramesorhizobium deserti]